MNEQELKAKLSKITCTLCEEYSEIDNRCVYFTSYEDCPMFNKIVEALIADGIGDVSEWKHRAEVAERALKREFEIYADNICPYNENSKKCKECEEKMLCSTEYATQCYFELAIQQAEEELQEEERK